MFLCQRPLLRAVVNGFGTETFLHLILIIFIVIFQQSEFATELFNCLLVLANLNVKKESL